MGIFQRVRSDPTRSQDIRQVFLLLVFLFISSLLLLSLRWSHLYVEINVLDFVISSLGDCRHCPNITAMKLTNQVVCWPTFMLPDQSTRGAQTWHLVLIYLYNMTVQYSADTLLVVKQQHLDVYTCNSTHFFFKI